MSYRSYETHIKDMRTKQENKRHIPVRILGLVDNLKALSKLEKLGLVEEAEIESIDKQIKAAINTTKAKA